MSPEEQEQPWFGAEMRRRRIEAGKSLRALSAEVHYSKGYLSRIETGAKQPHPDLARLVDAALGANGALLGLVRPSPRGRRRADEPPTTSLMGLVLPGAGGHVAEAMGGLRDDPMAVDAYELMFAHIRDSGRAVPAHVLVDHLRQVTTVLVQAGVSSRGEHQARLLRLGARYAEFLGWMLQEQGDDAEAMTWTDHAVYLAEAARDEAMTGHALVRRALFALYRGDAEQTIGLAARAAETPGVSTRVQRLALQREAQGHALAVDHHATRRALARAEALPTDDEEGSPLPLGPAATVGSHATTLAWCLVDLGDVRQAAEILDNQVVLIPPDNRRSRARFGVRRALAHALNGDADRACAAAEFVLPDVRAVRSATVNHDVERLNRNLVRWHRHPPVQRLASQLHAVLHPAGPYPG